jgi:hypothetical protein
MLKSRLAIHLTILTFGLLLSSCGSDNAGQTKEPLRINAQLEPAYLEENYNASFLADGGIRPYKFTLSGKIPKGINYSNGRLSGTPTEKGSFEIVATVEDANLNSRSEKLTLNVGETPPPKLEQVFPLAETSDPFVYLLRVRDREAKGFQAQIPLKDVKPTLDTIRAAEGLLYVVRYTAQTGTLDIDTAFVAARKDFEMMRINFTPDKPVRPQFDIRLTFYDKNGRVITGSAAINRTTSEGRYKYADLNAVARNWGRRATATVPAPAPARPGTPTTPAAPARPAALEGDLNNDGVVNARDLDLLRSSYAWAAVSVGLPPAPEQRTAPTPAPAKPEDEKAPAPANKP